MKDFNKNGFEIASLFSKEEITNFELTLNDLLKMQAKKLKIKNYNTSNIEVLCVEIQKIYPKALDEVFTTLRNSSVGHQLAGNSKLEKLAKSFLNSNSPLVISGPSFFVNLPSSLTRKYTWHSEQNWYPKRRNFLNIWCPIIHDRPENESMSMLIGSHKKDWFHFTEYTGYNGEFDPNALVQYEIPENLIRNYDESIPKVDKGEAIFFDGKLVHRSVDSKSKHPLFTIVFRAFDYSNDLTLSSNWADLPYNRKSIGFPNINIE